MEKFHLPLEILKAWYQCIVLKLLHSFGYSFLFLTGSLCADMMLNICFLDSDLSRNQFSRQIPDEIGDCSLLKSLYVIDISSWFHYFRPKDVDFTDVYTFKVLTWLHLANLGTCRSMSSMEIYHIQFPSWNNWKRCKNSSNVKLVDLFRRKISSLVIPSLWSCSILKNNQLAGPIPSTLSQIPNLKIL